jgi:hypothetical protein
VVQLIHQPDINDNKQAENDFGSLVGEPESERETKKMQSVESINEDDAEKIGDDEPDRQKNGNIGNVAFPISLEFLFSIHESPHLKRFD